MRHTLSSMHEGYRASMYRSPCGCRCLDADATQGDRHCVEELGAHHRFLAGVVDGGERRDGVVGMQRLGDGSLREREDGGLVEGVTVQRSVRAARTGRARCEELAQVLGIVDSWLH